MEEHRGREESGGDVAPVDDLIEVVQLAGIVEGGEDEGDQAEQVKVQRA